MRSLLASKISSYNKSEPLIQRPIIIAEAGVNHEGSMDLAKRLIDEAAEGGAQAIKFQSYKAETLASKHSPAYWDTSKEPTTSQYELFKKHDSFWKSEFEKLKIYCDKVGIEFLSTPFDTASADFLNDLMDVYKISSSDITNYPFIKHICLKGKPILLSTGASNMLEIREVVDYIENFGVPLSLLHCILNYPTADSNANLGMIIDLRRSFPKFISGYSDHTLPDKMDNLITANLLGAVILEKHFTHDKSLPGNDHYHAMDKKDLKLFWKKYNPIYETIGSQNKFSLESEEISRLNARRSLVANSDLPKGTIIEESHLTWKRPAHGISPKDIEQVLGKEVVKHIQEDEIISWTHFE
jgi:N-acetylneuraminate synthase